MRAGNARDALLRLPIYANEKSERKNAVYWHTCLLYAQGESMSNQSLRERFGLSDKKEKHGGDVSSNQRVPRRGIDKGRGRGCGRQISKVYSVLGLKGRSGKLRQLVFVNDEALL